MFKYPIAAELFEKMIPDIYDDINGNVHFMLKLLANSDDRDVQNIVSKLDDFNWLDFENTHKSGEKIVSRTIKEVAVETIRDAVPQYFKNENNLEDFYNSEAYDELESQILYGLKDYIYDQFVYDFYGMMIDANPQDIEPSDFCEQIDRNKLFNLLAEHIFEDAEFIFRGTYSEISRHMDEKIEELVDAEIESIADSCNYSKDCVSEFLDSSYYENLLDSIKKDVENFIEDNFEALATAPL